MAGAENAGMGMGIHLQMEGIYLFVKILGLRKGRKEGGKFKSLEVRLQVHRT